jgi:hypothetical protein
MVVSCPGDHNLWKASRVRVAAPEVSITPVQVFSLERFHCYEGVSLPGQLTAVNVKGTLPHQAYHQGTPPARKTSGALRLNNCVRARVRLGAVMVKAAEVAESKVEPTVVELLARVQAVNACSHVRAVKPQCDMPA